MRSPRDLPSYSERLQLAIASIQLGDLAGYTALSDLIDEALP